MHSDKETLEQKAAWFIVPLAILLYNAPTNLRRLWRWVRYEVPTWKLLGLLGMSIGLFVGATVILSRISRAHPNIAGALLLLVMLNFYVHLFIVIPVTVRRITERAQKEVLKRLQGKS